MKKAITLLACMLAVLLTNAQTSSHRYEYPVKPGTEAWKKIKTFEALRAVCQIPKDSLAKLSTESLLLACLDYPLNTVLLMYSTPQSGFTAWRKQFNGIDALFARADRQTVLLKHYQAFDMGGTIAKGGSKVGQAYRLGMLEAILVQDEILGSFSDENRRLLTKSLTEKYRQLNADPDLGWNMAASTGRIILKLAAAANPALKSTVNSAVADLINSGVANDKAILQQEIENAIRQ